jgi:hypothetical protein
MPGQQTNGLDVHTDDDELDVFDVDVLIAERDQRPFRWRWAGEIWQFPAAMDIRIVQLVDQGELLQAMEMLMGSEQWAHLIEVPEILDAVTLKSVVDRYIDRQGLTPPNSPRPSPYSRGGRGR